MTLSSSVATAIARAIRRDQPAGAHLTGGLLAKLKPVSAAGHGQAPPAAPVLLWALVVAAALLAFFVHLLDEQVQRGQMLREQQRAAATRATPPTTASTGQFQPVNWLVASRQPLASR